MPVLPKEQSKVSEKIDRKAGYACAYCGSVETLSAPKKCSRCRHEEWVEAINTKRVA